MFSTKNMQFFSKSNSIECEYIISKTAYIHNLFTRSKTVTRHVNNLAF